MAKAEDESGVIKQISTSVCVNLDNVYVPYKKRKEMDIDILAKELLCDAINRFILHRIEFSFYCVLILTF